MGSGRESLGDLGEGGVGELEGAVHVDVPVEEETDFGRASGGGAADGEESGDAVDGVLDGLGDGDLHLLDGHDTVVDADDDAGEVGLREDGDGYLEGTVDTGEGEDDEEEEDGFGGAGEPEAGLEIRLGVWAGSGGGAHLSSPSFAADLPAAGLASSESLPSAGGVPILTLVLSSRP